MLFTLVHQGALKEDVFMNFRAVYSIPQTVFPRHLSGAAMPGGGATALCRGLEASVDYLFHPFILQDRDSFTMPFYVGPGIRVVDYDQGRSGPSYLAIGIRGVVGILFDFKKVPLDVFIEIAGIPEYGFDDHGFNIRLNADAGIRYYF